MIDHLPCSETHFYGQCVTKTKCCQPLPFDFDPINPQMRGFNGGAEGEFQVWFGYSMLFQSKLIIGVKLEEVKRLISRDEYTWSVALSF